MNDRPRTGSDGPEWADAAGLSLTQQLTTILGVGIAMRDWRFSFRDEALETGQVVAAHGFLAPIVWHANGLQRVTRLGASFALRFERDSDALFGVVPQVSREQDAPRTPLVLLCLETLAIVQERFLRTDQCAALDPLVADFLLERDRGILPGPALSEGAGSVAPGG